jgi:hypothetical protein
MHCLRRLALVRTSTSCQGAGVARCGAPLRDWGDTLHGSWVSRKLNLKFAAAATAAGAAAAEASYVAAVELLIAVTCGLTST